MKKERQRNRKTEEQKDRGTVRQRNRKTEEQKDRETSFIQNSELLIAILPINTTVF